MRRRQRYFAYGSNLCAAQMAARCPGAREDGVVELAGWRFVINGRGVATLAPEPGARVFGLVWRLTPACEAALDRHEGVAKGAYRKAELEAGGAPALVYLAADTAPGAPRQGYPERILRAAEACGLDDAYRAELARWACLHEENARHGHGRQARAPAAHPPEPADDAQGRRCRKPSSSPVPPRTRG